MKSFKLIPLCFVVLILALTACEKEAIKPIGDQNELSKKKDIRGAEEPTLFIEDNVPIVSEGEKNIDLNPSEIKNYCTNLSYTIGSNWEMFISVEAFCPNYSIQLVNSFGQVAFENSLLDGTCLLFMLNALSISYNKCGNHKLVIYDESGNVYQQTPSFYLGYSFNTLCWQL